MPTTWVVVADEAIAFIYERPRSGGDLKDVEQLTDAAAHTKRNVLHGDAYGRRGSGDLRNGGNSTTSAADNDESHIEAAQFAARVAKRLTEALQQKRFDALRIVAAPRFLGLLRKALDKNVADTVESELDRDLIHLDRRELTRRLFAPHVGGPADG